MADWDRLELSECMKAWGDYFDFSSSGALTKLARLVLRWAPRVAAMQETLRTIALDGCPRAAAARRQGAEWADCGECPACLARAALEAEERARTGD